MFSRIVRRGLIWAAAMSAAIGAASAHEIVGNRMFPATLTIDDPGVADELALPTVSVTKTGDDPSVRQTDVSFEYAKRITEDFGVSFGTAWTHLGAPGGPTGTGASGFQNIEGALKYRLYKNPAHEFVLSAGLEIEFGASGAAGVGAEPVTSYEPAIFFGKGFGDLPASINWARPFAVTGAVGYSIPASSQTVSFDPDSGDIDTELNPKVLSWGGSLQYSMPYLKSSVVDLGLPDFINRLIPIVEFSMETPVENTLTSDTVTTGTISPGILYIGDTYQVGVEALIPVNRESGSGVGVIGQLHFFLDDLLPNTLGRPIFGHGVSMKGG